MVNDKIWVIVKTVALCEYAHARLAAIFCVVGVHLRTALHRVV